MDKLLANVSKDKLKNYFNQIEKDNPFLYARIGLCVFENNNSITNHDTLWFVRKLKKLKEENFKGFIKKYFTPEEQEIFGTEIQDIIKLVKHDVEVDLLDAYIIWSCKEYKDVFIENVKNKNLDGLFFSLQKFDKYGIIKDILPNGTPETIYTENYLNNRWNDLDQSEKLRLMNLFVSELSF